MDESAADPEIEWIGEQSYEKLQAYWFLVYCWNKVECDEWAEFRLVIRSRSQAEIIDFLQWLNVDLADSIEHKVFAHHPPTYGCQVDYTVCAPHPDDADYKANTMVFFNEKCIELCKWNSSHAMANEHQTTICLYYIDAGCETDSMFGITGWKPVDLS